MSAFQVATTYPPRRYLRVEPPSNTSSKGHAVDPSDAVDQGFTQSYVHGQCPSKDGVDGYFHQGYQAGHFIQGQVYGPPGSEYYQHYHDDGSPIPPHGYAIGDGSGIANLRSPTSIEIPTSFNETAAVSSLTTVPAALDCPYGLYQRVLPSTSFSISPSNPSSIASWTAAVQDTTYDRSQIDQVWLPGLNHDQGWGVFPSSGGAAFGSSNAMLGPLSPSLGSLAKHQATSFDHSISERPPGNFFHHWSLAAKNTVHTATLPSFPRHNSFSPSPYHGPQQNPSLGSDGRQYYGVYLPQNNSTSTPRHPKGPAHAIKYEGLRMDEEELLGGRMAPDGKITVHQCRWEEDLSPCHLWIKGDKSCINTHIQKWHGGKPGGDKLEVVCRWSTCQKKMLKESISRHVVTRHLGEKWKCQGCKEEIVRKDAYERHASKEGCRDAGALIMYYANARMIDARAALAEGGGYADA